ncbi:MAG TPA: NUDIX hydrolase [Patescibacteria group bacterium]
MENRPKVGVGVFIRKENKVLLIKRRGSHGEGTWGLVGGHLEFGETPEACAIREVNEETGLTITPPQRMCFTNDIFPEEQKHYITLFLTADHIEGEAENKEPEVCETLEWFEWDNLPTPLFLPLVNLHEAGHNPFTI